ncbi:MAG: M24 family metallopeptidase [Hyphomicrobiales bacterium]|nr:M24 family metallopeptidase [Hyphomicrobiales bacterium]
MAADFPLLSGAERERRYSRARELMTSNDVACLVVFGRHNRERYDGYLSNEQSDGIVILPLEEEPIYLVNHWGRITRRIEDDRRPDQTWIKDCRLGMEGACVVRALEERGLSSARLGVVGLTARGAGENEGFVPYTTWTNVLSALPNAEFVELSAAFQRMMLVKSDEELEVARFCGKIGERACEAILDAIEVGVPESDLYAAAFHVIHKHRAVLTYPHIAQGIGRSTIGWGNPNYFYTGGPPHVVARGDVLQLELLLSYGGIEIQPQMSIAVEPVSDLCWELAEVARRVYAAGLAALKPGRRFGDACDDVDQPIKQFDGWQTGPGLHSLGPHWLTSGHFINADRCPRIAPHITMPTAPGWGLDHILEPSMIFAIEPSPGKGNQRIHTGGCVILHADRVEQLHHLGTDLRVVG